MPRSRNVAPSDSTCSRTAGRTSKPETTAPSRRAVAIACSPATPAPRTRIFAGGIVPAAVISIGKKRGRRSAAMRAALYPLTVACEDSASIGCARVMRGTDSRANASTPADLSRATPSASVSGDRNATSAWPLRSRDVSFAVGDATFTIASASHGSPTVAPASRYASSANPAATPAPASTTTSTPSPSRDTVSGTRATRRSPAAVSFGTPTRIVRERTSRRGGAGPPRPPAGGGGGPPRPAGGGGRLPAVQRAAHEPAQRARLVGGAEGDDVAALAAEAGRRDPVPRERGARRGPVHREAAAVGQLTRLVVALGDADLPERVVTDAEARVHAHTHTLQRDELQRRRVVAGDGRRDGRRRGVGADEVGRPRGGGRLALRRMRGHERAHAVARVGRADAVRLAGRAGDVQAAGAVTGAPLPLVRERRRAGAPGAVRDGQRVAGDGAPGDRRLDRVGLAVRRADDVGRVGRRRRRAVGVLRGHDDADRVVDGRRRERVRLARRADDVAARRAVGGAAPPLVAVRGRAVAPRPVARGQRRTRLLGSADARLRRVRRRSGGRDAGNRSENGQQRHDRCKSFQHRCFLPCSLEGRTHSGRSIRAFSRRDNGRDPISGTATYKVLTLAPVTHLLATYGLVVLFFAIAIESAGVPIPGETALITAAVFASTNQHHFSIVWVVVVAAAGAIIGDNVGYILGRIGGRRLVEKIGPLRKELPRGERFFEKHGGKTVFFGRFVAFLRITSAWLAGITK